MMLPKKQNHSHLFSSLVFISPQTGIEHEKQRLAFGQPRILGSLSVLERSAVELWKPHLCSTHANKTH